MGPSKDTHGTPMPVREGRGWAHNSIHSATNVHNSKADTTVFSNIHGSGTVLSPVQLSQDPALNRTDTLDKKLTDSLWAVASNGDRKQKETRLTLEATQIKSEELINKSSKPAEHVINTMEMKQLYNTIRAQGEARR